MFPNQSEFIPFVATFLKVSVVPVKPNELCWNAWFKPKETVPSVALATAESVLLTLIPVAIKDFVPVTVAISSAETVNSSLEVARLVLK